MYKSIIFFSIHKDVPKLFVLKSFANKHKLKMQVCRNEKEFITKFNKYSLVIYNKSEQEQIKNIQKKLSFLKINIATYHLEKISKSRITTFKTLFYWSPSSILTTGYSTPSGLSSTSYTGLAHTQGPTDSLPRRLSPLPHCLLALIILPASCHPVLFTIGWFNSSSSFNTTPRNTCSVNHFCCCCC